MYLVCDILRLLDLSTQAKIQIGNGIRLIFTENTYIYLKITLYT